MEPDDPLPALIADIDQAIAMAPQLARTTRGLFDAFKAEGFTDGQALWLSAAQLKTELGEPPD